MESYGLRCTYAGDIATGQDALALDTYGDADAIITNPPFTRQVMHALIEHFERIAPTWLLMELDWVSTAASDAVSAGLLGHRDDRPGEMVRGL